MKSPVPLPPPFLALFFLFFSYLLKWLMPPVEVNLPFHFWIGIALFAAGFSLAGTGFSIFMHLKTPIRPGFEPSRLATIGPYRFTRNPMYLGTLIFLIGGFFLIGSLYLLLAPIGFFLVINFRLIPFEERMLANQFGKSYDDYRNRVRRWL